MNGAVKISVLLGVLLMMFACGWLVGTVYPRAFVYEVMVLWCGSGIVITLGIINRLSLFRRKLRMAIRHLLDNNFHTGISVEGRDEIAQLSRDFNRLVDRMLEYDALRSKKIFTLSRLIKSVVREVSDRIVIFDLESGRLSLNQATQELFGVSQDELTIDSVIRLEANQAFAQQYALLSSGKANTATGEVELCLPVLRAKARVAVNLFAIKDPDENVQMVVCMLVKR